MYRFGHTECSQMDAWNGLQPHVFRFDLDEVVRDFFFRPTVPKLTCGLEEARVVFIRWPTVGQTSNSYRVPLCPSDFAQARKLESSGSNLTLGARALQRR